jgi:hypothetical protein
MVNWGGPRRFVYKKVVLKFDYSFITLFFVNLGELKPFKNVKSIKAYGFNLYSENIE